MKRHIRFLSIIVITCYSITFIFTSPAKAEELNISALGIMAGIGIGELLCLKLLNQNKNLKELKDESNIFFWLGAFSGVFLGLSCLKQDIGNVGGLGGSGYVALTPIYVLVGAMVGGVSGITIYKLFGKPISDIFHFLLG